MARVFKPAQFSVLPQTAFGADPWLQEPVQSGHCFASNGDEFSGGEVPKAPKNGEAGRSITAREAPTPVAWSNRAELHELFEKIPIGQRFFFLCRNIERLTYEDLKDCWSNDYSGQLEYAEVWLNNTLLDILRKGRDLKWQSLPDDLYAEFDLYGELSNLLDILCALEPEWDSKLAWNLFPIAERALRNSDPKIRIKAVNLATVFEANLTGQEAQMARDELMVVLEKEKDSEVCANLIEGLGDIGSRDDHGDHLALAGTVTRYLANCEEGVRIKVIQALIRIVPQIGGDESQPIKDIQGILSYRLKEEKSPLVREWLRTAIAQLDNLLRDVAQETSSSVDAAQSPVAWSSREELLAIVEKIPVGQRFAFFCLNIERLTYDDVNSCLQQDSFYTDEDLSDVAAVEPMLVFTLRDILGRKKVNWSSLPHAIYEESSNSGNLNKTLRDLCDLVPELDSELSWNLFPIVLRCFGHPDLDIRIEAVKLATIFEENLAGAQAWMARGRLMEALRKEKDSDVCVSLIRGLGEIGSRGDHDDHLALANAVVPYLAGDHESVRIAVARALIEMAPRFNEREFIQDLQYRLLCRNEDEKSALVQEWLRTAIRELGFRLVDVAQEAPPSVDAGQLPVAWSSREELHAIVEKIPVGQRFAFFCRNIEGLTSDDVQSCLDNCFFDPARSYIARSSAEIGLICVLRDILERTGTNVTWKSLRNEIAVEYGRRGLGGYLSRILNYLSLLAPEFDSKLSWNLVDVALRFLRDTYPQSRIEASYLLTKLEANLSGVQARMVREELMVALEKEKDSEVCANLIESLGKIGSRDDHGDHETLAGVVVRYLNYGYSPVRLEAIHALVKMSPYLHGVSRRNRINIADLQNIFLVRRFEEEANDVVHGELRAAIAYLADQSEDYVYIKSLLESLEQKAAQGQRQPPGPQVDRLRAVDMLRRLGGRSSRLDNRIAAALEEFWKDVEPEVREAAFDAWAEVIQNLEPEHALERAEAAKARLDEWNSSVVYFITLEGLGKLIPFLDVEKRFLFVDEVGDWMRAWQNAIDPKDVDLERIAKIIADNLENLKPEDQREMVETLLHFLWKDNRRLVEKQSDDVVSIFENIGRHLSTSDLRDLIEKVRREHASASTLAQAALGDGSECSSPYGRILAVLTALPRLRHYEATVIKAAVRRAGVGRTTDDGKGYLNRGAHKGDRPTKGGFDFRDLREVRLGEPIGRIDPAATARMGTIHERIYHQEQSRPVMILVDPLSYCENDRDSMRYLIGTIAQFVIAQRDPVGIVIGRSEIYIKPSHDRSSLVAVLKAMFDAWQGYDKGSILVDKCGVVPLLEMRTVRMNMSRGAEIILVSPFEDDDFDGVERVIGRLKKRGVNVRPIKVRGEFLPKEPVVQMGGVDLKVDEGLVDRKLKADEAARRKQCEDFLRRMGGFYFDLREKQGVADIAVKVATDLRLGQAIEIQPEEIETSKLFYQALDGERDDRRFDDQIPTIDELMERTYALEETRVAGNGHVFSFIKEQLDTAFGLRKRQITGDFAFKLADLKDGFDHPTNPTALEVNGLDSYFSRERWGVEGVTYALDEWMGEQLPLHEAIAFGPGWSFWSRFCEMYRTAQKIKEEGTAQPSGIRQFFGRLFDRGGKRKDRVPSLHRSKSETPDDTGVSKKEKEGKDPVWQRARKLKGRYLRNFVGVDLDSAHAAYRARDELSPESFDLEGERKAVGAIKAGSGFDDGDLPRPSHGKIERVEKKGKKTKVHYRLAQSTPEEAQKIMGMKLSAFRAAAAQMYGAELYAALTDSIALEDVNTFVQEEWREFIEGLDDVTVGEAMRIIQGYIINHPKITYHRYTEDPLKEIAFNAFQERAREGGAKGKDEYMQTALSLGGGVCVELARIAVSMMRLAGIPAAYSTGWMVESGGRVFVPTHGWADVVFPNGEGKWHAEPVEVSTRHASKDLMKAAASALGAFRDMLAKSEEEQEEHAPATPTTEESADKEPTAGEETKVEEEQEDVPQPQPQSKPAFVVESQPESEPEPEPEPERAPVEDVLHRLPSMWASADAQRRELIAGWVGSLPAIVQLARKKWPGTETRVVDMIMRNWQSHLNMQRVSSDSGVHGMIRIIQRQVDTADDEEKAALDKWARVAQKLLK